MENKSKQIGIINGYSVYLYRGYKHYILPTGIAHIDRQAKLSNESHIDRVIYNKENPTKPTKSNQECLDEFMKLCE